MRQPLRPPRQQRSRATLHRFLEATLALLAERRFDEAPVAEIARRARSSVGAFYARFEGKEALVACLNQRLFEEGRARWDAFLAPGRWRRRDAAAVVRGVVRHVVEKRRANRGLLRALALHARSRPLPAFAEAAAASNRHVYALVRELLLARRAELGHPDPGRAIAVGLLLVDAATREAIVFDEAQLAPGGLSDAVLVRELSAAWLAYLGAGPARRRR